jgi:hypothetical protein
MIKQASDNKAVSTVLQKAALLLESKGETLLR